MNAPQNGSHVTAVRDHNQGLVLGLVLRLAGPSRSEIAERIGLTAAAVSRITRDLIDSGLVVEGTQQAASPGQRGRRNIQLLPSPRGAFFLAVSLTIADRRVALMDLSGRRLGELGIPGGLPRSYAGLTEAIEAAARRLVAAAAVPRARLLGLAAVTSGAVDAGGRRVLNASLEVLRGRELAADLEHRLGLQVTVDTVGRALGVAEALLGARNGTSLPGPTLVLHVAFGLGTAVLLDGSPLRSMADERLAGHVAVPGARGRCVCGAVGCLMTAAAGFGILGRLGPAAMQPASWRDMRPRDLAAAVAEAHRGPGPAATAFAAAGKVLGRTLFALGAPVGPQQMILGGPVAQAAPFEAAARRGMAEAYGRAGLTAPALLVSRIDYLRAAELLAMVEFALRRPLDLDRLLAGAESAPL